jgi:hypothetical protein
MEKPTAAQMYIQRMKLGDLKLPVVEFKEWKPDPATLRVWDRAANPSRKEPGDGR